MLLSNTSKLQVVYMSMFVEMSVTHDMTYEKMFRDSVVSRLLGTTMCISLKEVAALNDDETRIFFTLYCYGSDLLLTLATIRSIEEESDNGSPR